VVVAFGLATEVSLVKEQYRKRGIMKKTALLLTGLVALVAVAPVVHAQVQGIEITPTFGYRFSGNLSSQQSYIGYYIDSIKVPNSVSYGLTLEYPFHPSMNAEILWSHQASKIEVTGKPVTPSGSYSTTTIADLGIDTIQAGILWQSGRSGDRFRGFFDLLIGATILSPSNSAVPMSSLTRFSASIGGGAKLFVSDNIGFKFSARYMPVYINSSDSGYYYCDEYWGCYTYYNTTYLNQFDTSAGLIIRF